jgi:hypothetical protein
MAEDEVIKNPGGTEDGKCPRIIEKPRPLFHHAVFGKGGTGPQEKENRRQQAGNK